MKNQITENIATKIGGFLGLGKKLSTSTITLEKDVYTVGDTIKVRISCDNSACAKAVSGFKLKLIRNIKATINGNEQKHAHHRKYISIF